MSNSQRQRFFEIGEQDLARFPRIVKLIRRHAPGALSRLYDRIAATPAIASLFPNRERIDHARQAQTQHWEAMFSGRLSDDYFAKAEQIGNVHARIGLEPSWYIGGYAVVLEELIVNALRKALPTFLDGGASAKTVASMVKLALFDMDLALSAYFRAEQAKRDDVIEKLNELLARMEMDESVRNAAGARIFETLALLANNDFTAVLEGLPEEFADFEKAFGEMRANVSRTIAGVAHSVSGINTGAAEIRAASDDLALRTQQQAASLEETSATMEQLTQGVENAAKGAEEVTASVIEANREASLGEGVARDAVDAIVAIQRSAQEIAKIIELIDGIVFQTNLVALNAGVEAVRAGDAGKGFAVVANEVRALAQRSAEAAREIKELVTGSIDQVSKGVQLVSRSGDAFSRIAGRVSEIAEQAARISDLSRSQSSSLQQVNMAVREMERMTQNNAAMVEQTTAAARSLAGEARDLDGMVTQFRFSTPSVVTPIPLARRRHVRDAAPLRQHAASPESAAAVNADWSEF